MSVPEVRALLHHLLEVRAWDTAEILKWSAWRQERNRRAAASHRKLPWVGNANRPKP